MIKAIKTLCCASAALLCSTSISAQSIKFQKELNLGIYGGANICMMSFAPSFQTNMMIRSNFGVTARFIHEKYFGLQAELGYSQRGWSRYLDNEQSTYFYNRKMEYLELPLLSHITFGHKVRGFVNIGPKISFLLSENESTNLTPPVDATSPNQEVGLATENKFDWGIMGGAGVEFNTKIGSFILEGRYYFGLGNIFKSTKLDPFSQSSFQNIQVNVCYLLPNLLAKSIK